MTSPRNARVPGGLTGIGSGSGPPDGIGAPRSLDLFVVPGFPAHWTS